MKNFFILAAILIISISSCKNKEKKVDNTSSNTSVKKPGDSTLVSSKKVIEELQACEKGTYKYTVEDFFKKPEKTYFQISPDGQFYSYLGKADGRMNLFVQKIGEEKSQQLTKETARDLQAYFWASASRICYIKDDGGDENFKLFAINKDGSNPKDLTPFDSVTIQIIDDLPDNDDEMIIGMNKDNPMLHEPYRLNINTGKLDKLAENKDVMNPVSSWLTDHNGKLRVCTKVSDGVNMKLMYREKESDTFRTVLTTNFKEQMAPLFFDFDNGAVIYASSNIGRDKSSLVKFDLASGKEIAKIYEDPNVDVDDLQFSKKRKVITQSTTIFEKRATKFFDKETETIYNRCKKELGNYEVVVTDADKAEDKFLVRTYSDKSKGAYYLYDKTSDKLTKIADLSPWLNETEMSDMKPVTYTSRDGMTIHGYLSLPKGVDPKNLPVIINPHGGPWARDYWGFNPEIQLLTNRGYAVLQMNFRGSTGFGRKFWEASFKQWGQNMQNDITDGADWLVAQGIADPKRIAIYGASYGGYATLAGVTYTPDKYACAIDYVGVSNLFSFMKTIPPYWKPFLTMMYEMVGDPAKDEKMFTAFSPALNSDKIKTPLFVAQGANDPRVNIDESDQIVKALRARKIDVPYMVKYDEGHGYHNEENQYDFYKTMVGFFAKYLKNYPVKG